MENIGLNGLPRAIRTETAERGSRCNPCLSSCQFPSRCAGAGIPVIKVRHMLVCTERAHVFDVSSRVAPQENKISCPSKLLEGTGFFVSKKYRKELCFCQAAAEARAGRRTLRTVSAGSNTSSAAAAFETAWLRGGRISVKFEQYRRQSLRYAGELG